MIKIRELRQRIGLTQVELSEKLHIGQSTVAMWENGVNMPRSDKLPEIAKVLECEVSDLFGSD